MLENEKTNGIYGGLTYFAHHTDMSQLLPRLKALGVHACISLLFAAGAAALVFWVWYPYPYREISGGRELFFLVMGVDVVLGPLVTFILFNPAKTRRALTIDFSLVAVLQLSALAYGLWTVSVARPVYLAFEYNRFRVVHAIDVPEDLLDKAEQVFRRLPWTGPKPIGLRDFRNANEQADATLAALSGLQLGARPDLWIPYDQVRSSALKGSHPLTALRTRFPDQAALIDQRVQQTGRPITALAYMPMVGRKTFWTVVLDAQTADILGYLPIDSF